MESDVESVLAELDGHRMQFIVLCRSLSDEQLARPVPNSTWIVRDFIAHLGTIDGPVAEMFRSVHDGADPGMRTTDGERFDVDRWNDARVLERREKTVDELLFELRQSARPCERRSGAHRGRPREIHQVQRDARRPPDSIPLGAYLKGWCKHDVMHAVDMVRALPDAMGPRLERWFDDPIVARYQQAMNA